MEQMWRLAWALPLVLCVGVAAVALLRLAAGKRAPAAPATRLRVRESAVLSTDTSVHLLEVDGAAMIVVESARNVSLHAPSAPALANGVVSRPRASAWLKRFGVQGAP